MIFLLFWVVIGAIVSTIWSKYVNGHWWSGTIAGFVAQIIIWPFIAAILIIDHVKTRNHYKH